MLGRTSAEELLVMVCLVEDQEEVEDEDDFGPTSSRFQHSTSVPGSQRASGLIHREVEVPSFAEVQHITEY